MLFDNDNILFLSIPSQQCFQLIHASRIVLVEKKDVPSVEFAAGPLLLEHRPRGNKEQRITPRTNRNKQVPA
jgi:hypothetical protein